ncbi:MAG: ATP phosphoribosyltransferase regulatory subunit [Pseudomonadota bacterium]
MKSHRWQLPDGVDELLPPVARQMEHLRREVLDVFHRWGFDLIDPPLLEYLDSLLVASGGDLDLQTLKATDQRSGRLLGIRADLTSQAVRVDAQHGSSDDVSRLCYAAPVVFANPVGVHESRVPMKAGAEIFGVPGLEADAEIVALMQQVLRQGGLDDVVLVLGHMGLFRALLERADLDEQAAAALFAAVQLKSETDICALVPAGVLRDQLVALPQLMGDRAVLDDARRALGAGSAAAGHAIDELEVLSELITARLPGTSLRYDLSELAGFGYHTGPLYAAYHRRQGRALARGGRYDGVGAAFGRNRPATGFDVHLKPLLSTQQSFRPATAVWVGAQALQNSAADARTALLRQVDALRAAGRRVVMGLAATEAPPADCQSVLTLKDGQWYEQPLTGR